MSVQENIAAYEIAKANVLAHCMCLKFQDLGGKFLVIYPEGYFPQGCRVNYSDFGKTKALEIMLEKMEQHWKDSFIK